MHACTSDIVPCAYTQPASTHARNHVHMQRSPKYMHTQCVRMYEPSAIVLHSAHDTHVQSVNKSLVHEVTLSNLH